MTTLEIITGAMFNRKSWELIIRVENSRHARKRALCVKPLTDTRNDRCIAARRIDENGKDVIIYSLPALTIDDPWEIMEHLERERTEVLAIDEGHLFKPSIVDVVTALLDRNDGPDLRIIVSGLDMDFNRKPFVPMALLMAMANRPGGVEKKPGICMKCGAEDAAYTQALHPLTSNTQVGSRELYEVRCRACHTI